MDTEVQILVASSVAWLVANHRKHEIRIPTDSGDYDKRFDSLCYGSCVVLRPLDGDTREDVKAKVAYVGLEDGGATRVLKVELLEAQHAGGDLHSHFPPGC